jgi:hypothetical protein
VDGFIEESAADHTPSIKLHAVRGVRPSPHVLADEAPPRRRDRVPPVVGSGHQELRQQRVDEDLAVADFGLDTLPPDAQVEMTARGETSRQPLGRVGLTIQELNLVPGDYSQQFVGTVKNETAEEVTGPISVLVACFDEGGQPIDTVNGFTNEDSLAPDTVGSFTLTLSDIDVCPRFLAGSSGFNW